MPRKPNKTDKYEDGILEQMRAAARQTTQTQRQEVYKRWCAGDYEYTYTISDHLAGTSGICLTLVALIESEHPLIVEAGKLRYSLTGCLTKIIAAEITAMKNVHI